MAKNSIHNIDQQQIPENPMICPYDSLISWNKNYKQNPTDVALLSCSISREEKWFNQHQILKKFLLKVDKDELQQNMLNLCSFVF